MPNSIRRTLGALLACLSLSAWGALGDNFRVETYYARPGAVTYTWDRTGETIDTTYTIRRGGVIVRQSSPRTAVNGNDGILYFGETYDVTLQVNDGPESPPLRVTMPAPPDALPGGELLYIVLSFPDRDRPIAADTIDKVFGYSEWVTRVSGGRTVWRPTFVLHTLSKPFSDYTVNPIYWPDLIDIEKIKAELTQTFDLRNRAGLHRVAMDVEGLGIHYNSGSPMWLGTDIYGSPVSRNNFVHEIFHTYGLWHYGYLPSLPADPNDLSGLPLGYYSAEIMGSGAMTSELSTLNLYMLGWRDPAQLQKVAQTTTLTLTNNELLGGVQGAVIPLSAAGAAYVVEYRAPFVSVTYRPTLGLQSFSLMQVGMAFGTSGRILTDTQRGIAVDVLSANGSTASVRVTLPGGEPPPPPPPATTTVSILSPVNGSIVPAKSRISLSGATEPAGLPITWTASGGSISGSVWTAPGAKNKSYTLTATSGTVRASVTVRTR